MNVVRLSLFPLLATIAIGCTQEAPPEVETTSSSAEALDAYDRCDAVLEDDLFTKMASTARPRDTVIATFRYWLLAMSETGAYRSYSKHFDQQVSQASKGQLNVTGFGDLWGGHDASRKMTESEFGAWYVRTKALVYRLTASTFDTASARASSYASYVRDTATIATWQACVTRDAQPGLYAYGSRDEGAGVYVNVLWVPASFGGDAPSIAVSFPPTLQATVHADPTVMVPNGSSRAFSVTIASGTMVTDVPVNGTLTGSDGRVFTSFTSTARFPPFALDPAVLAPPPQPPPDVQWFDARDSELGSWWFHEDDTTWDRAGRAAADYCPSKGLATGFMNGYYAGDRHSVWCTRKARWFDIHDAELDSTSWSFRNNDATWDRAARAANDLCARRGFVGGRFNGYIGGDLHSLWCYEGDAAWIDARDSELDATGWGFRGNDATWYRAALAATDFCRNKGFLTGFLNGYVGGDRHGAVCIR